MKKELSKNLISEWSLPPLYFDIETPVKFHYKSEFIPIEDCTLLENRDWSVPIKINL
jgi:hypothetical protein